MVLRLGIVVLLAALGHAQDAPPVPTFGTTIVIPSGLRGKIYYIPRNSRRLPSFDKMKPVGTIYATALNVPSRPFNQGFPGVTRRFEWFAIDYTGRFWIQDPGVYEFSLTSDDGAKLYIDGRELIDNDGQHLPVTVQGRIDLSGGIHRMRVSYFQGPRYMVALVLKVAPPATRNSTSSVPKNSSRRPIPRTGSTATTRNCHPTNSGQFKSYIYRSIVIATHLLNCDRLPDLPRLFSPIDANHLHNHRSGLPPGIGRQWAGTCHIHHLHPSDGRARKPGDREPQRHRRSG